MSILKFNQFINEELKPETYRSAAEKLRKKKHVARAGKLSHWAHQQQIGLRYRDYGLFNIDIELEISKSSSGYVDATPKKPSNGEKTSAYYAGMAVWGEGFAIEMEEDANESFLYICPRFVRNSEDEEDFSPFTIANKFVKNGDSYVYDSISIIHEMDMADGVYLFSDRASASKFKTKILRNIESFIKLDIPSLKRAFMDHIEGDSGVATEFDKFINGIKNISINDLYNP